MKNTTINIENSKEVLSKAFKFSNDIICTTDEKDTFLLVSDVSLKILGYLPEELSGKRYIDFVFEEDKIQSINQNLQARNKNSTFSYENRFVHKNGSLITLLWTSTWDNEEKVTYHIAKDITNYKEIFKKNKETEGLLNEAQRFSKMGSWNFIIEANIVTWSDSLYDVFGVNKFLFNKTYNSFLDLVVPDDKEFVKKTSEKCQETGESFKITYRIITPNGEGRIIEEFGYSEKNIDGKIIRLFGTAQNITYRKKTEDLLANSNKKYKYLFENSPLPLFIFEFDTLQIIDCNIEALLLYGYSRDEFLSLTIKDIRPEEDIPLILKATSSSVKYGDIHKGTWRHLKKDGTIFYVNVTGHLIEYDDKKCSFVLISDITAKIEHQKKEKEYTQFIETTLENLPIGIAVNKIDDGTATFMNQKFASTYGWNKETLSDINNFFANVYPNKEYQEQMTQQVLSDIQSNDTQKMQWEGINITTKDGEKRIINAKNIPLFDQNLMISTVVDVTDKYKAQKDLEESNERYRYTTMATSDAIWDWDLRTNTFYWGEGINTLFGYQYLYETIHSAKTWYNLIHSQDHEIVSNSLLEVIRSQDVSWKIEHRLIKNNGTIAFVNQSAAIIRDADGTAIRMVGAIQDISERKIKEQQLKLLESVITNTKDAILITEAEPSQFPGPKIIFVNEAFTNMTGYTSEEVIGKTPRILQGPNTDKEELKKLSHALKTWQTCEITTINYDKYGNEFWSNFAITPVADGSGFYTHWISTQRDVTHKKIEEQKRVLINEISIIFNNQNSLKITLNKLLKKFSELYNYPIMGIWLIDDEAEQLNRVNYFKKNNINIKFDKSLDKILVPHFNEKGKGILGKVWETEKIVKWTTLCNEFDLVSEKESIDSEMKKITALPLLFNKKFIGTLVIAENEELIRYNDKTFFSEEICFHIGAEIIRKKLEQELSNIFNFSPDVVCVTNTTGKFKQINPVGCTLFGYTESELLTKNIVDFVHPEDLKKAKNKLIKLIRREQTVYFENRILTRNGEMKWMAWTSSSTKDKLIYSIGKDITDRKQSENELKILNENLLNQTKKLHISNEELEQFAYVASHDLQEPLRMVTSFLTLLEKKYRDKLDEKGIQYINFAVDGAKNMRQIILDLLNFSRVSNEDAGFENFELSDVVKDVCMLQSKLIKEKNATFIIGNLPTLYSVRHYLNQLFQNIISNALKYSREEVPLEIKIDSIEYKTHYQLSVKDNGIGIEKEYFEKIFIIFQRLHDKEEYQGNGMGLAIAKKIMDKLNGRIWVESQPGKGSVFYMIIPKK